MGHLLNSDPAPWEYVEMILCREWSCPPSVLREQSADDIYNALRMLNGEAQAQRVLTGGR